MVEVLSGINIAVLYNYNSAMQSRMVMLYIIVQYCIQTIGCSAPEHSSIVQLILYCQKTISEMQ